MAENGLMAVRLLMVISGFTIAISYAAARQQHHHHPPHRPHPRPRPPPRDGLCIPPGENGYYNYACNNESLVPVEIQQDLLESVVNEFPRQLAGPCHEGMYSDGDYEFMQLCVYASCSYKVSRKSRCLSCLERASKVIQERCGSALGAQAASRGCCIRYESFHFCRD